MFLIIYVPVNESRPGWMLEAAAHARGTGWDPTVR